LIGLYPQQFFELHAIAGSLFLFPVACFASYFNEELPKAYQTIITMDENGPFGTGFLAFMILIVFMVFKALRPVMIYKVVYEKPIE